MVQLRQLGETAKWREQKIEVEADSGYRRQMTAKVSEGIALHESTSGSDVGYDISHVASGRQIVSSVNLEAAYRASGYLLHFAGVNWSAQQPEIDDADEMVKKLIAIQTEKPLASLKPLFNMQNTEPRPHDDNENFGGFLGKPERARGCQEYATTTRIDLTWTKMTAKDLRLNAGPLLYRLIPSGSYPGATWLIQSMTAKGQVKEQSLQAQTAAQAQAEGGARVLRELYHPMKRFLGMGTVKPEIRIIWVEEGTLDKWTSGHLQGPDRELSRMEVERQKDGLYSWKIYTQEGSERYSQQGIKGRGTAKSECLKFHVKRQIESGAGLSFNVEQWATVGASEPNKRKTKR